MAARTAALLGGGLTAERVAASVSVAGRGESNVVEVGVQASSPVLAARIANTYVRQFVREQQASNRVYYRSALALVRRQLAALSPKQRVGPDGLALQDRAQTLGLLEELDYGNVQVAQEAVVPVSPSSPKTSKDTLLGGLLGLLIGVALAFGVERMDRRVRTPGELERIYGLPLLGVVPKSAAVGRAAGKDGRRPVLPAVVAEAFGLIRARLRFFGVQRPLRSVVIASPVAGEGKSTIARHLAQAAAQLGGRVLLLEVDLRQPTLAGQLGLEPGPGLVDVLLGTVRMSEAVRPVALQTPGVGGRTLDVLLAGSVSPPNPAELLESHAMSAVLDQAQSAYDLVVIDCPPLNAVSDAYPLLSRVDGVILVGWVGRSRTDAAQQLRQTLAASGAPLLGVIANAAKSITSRYSAPNSATPSLDNTLTASTTPATIPAGTPANTPAPANGTPPPATTSTPVSATPSDRQWS